MAWAHSEAPTEINLISSWDSHTVRTGDSDKVPSENLYCGRELKWSFKIDAEERPLRWFKLLLSQEARDFVGQRSSVMNKLLGDMQELGKDPVDVVADYLWLLWWHTLEILRQRLSQVTLDNLMFKIVLTIPAMWDDRAKDLTKKAAQKAGLTKS